MPRRTVGIIVLLLATTGCRRDNAPPPTNHQQNVPSPSGRYVLTIPIESSTKKHSSGTYTDVFWKVVICDSQGTRVYKDDDSNFIGHLEVYWIWDPDDRVWLYNSDDAQVWFWELVDGRWVKTNWGQGRRREIQRDITPPASLYPH